MSNRWLQEKSMFRSIGGVIFLLVVVKIFSSAASAFEQALVATFNTIEVVAELSVIELKSR